MNDRTNETARAVDDGRAQADTGAMAETVAATAGAGAGPKGTGYERITAAILAALAGDVPTWRRPWRTILSNDSRAIVTAASKAQAAADLIRQKMGAENAGAEDADQESGDQAAA